MTSVMIVSFTHIVPRLAGALAFSLCATLPLAAAESAFERAAANGRISAEGFERCHRYLHAWLRAVGRAWPKARIAGR